MGGIGSGWRWRFDAKDTTDSYRRLDVRRWAREGFLEAGRFFAWQWSHDGEPVASIRVQVETGAVRLIYRCRSNGGDWQDLNYRVWLDRTPCNYGGARTWFLCPTQGCGRRVAIIYGGKVFACRRCYDVAYPSQREDVSDRAARRCEKLRARLGWDGGIFDDTYEKPKGMHWRTYERLVQEVEASSQASLSSMMARFERDTQTLRLIRSLAALD
ncbi:hypothetical protein [Mameliella alba]|uniref:hypothetical protein n=1 Tax=Mameliella alba TaxID=561184 RepID=UPI000B52EB12|nr:hypothetical protein [Mameliella alba]OWV39464.1 hypothetical protein CDZ95_25705 [Mameliella alba]OWV64953.1 hypothetical protein CDZ97_08735 [Mameliella alba]